MAGNWIKRAKKMHRCVVVVLTCPAACFTPTFSVAFLTEPATARRLFPNLPGKYLYLAYQVRVERSLRTLRSRIFYRKYRKDFS